MKFLVYLPSALPRADKQIFQPLGTKTLSRCYLLFIYKYPANVLDQSLHFMGSLIMVAVLEIFAGFYQTFCRC